MNKWQVNLKIWQVYIKIWQVNIIIWQVMAKICHHKRRKYLPVIWIVWSHDQYELRWKYRGTVEINEPPIQHKLKDLYFE